MGPQPPRSFLDTPTVVQGHGVTHLYYRVRREG